MKKSTLQKQLTKIKKKEVYPNLYLLTFSSQYLLASTFIRFQEFYESPKFKNKLVSLEEFMDWYSFKYKNSFTYFDDWGGFNIPGYVIKEIERYKNRLNEKETHLLKLFHQEIEGTKIFYVIGVWKKYEYKKMTKEHEIAHGMFTLNGKYRNEVIAEIRKYNIKKFKKKLKKMRYDESVLIDEINAYMISDPREIISKRYAKKLKPLRERLKKLFKEEFSRGRKLLTN